MPKAVKIILITIGAVVLLGVILVPIAMIGMDEVRKYKIPDIDLNRIGDGEYEGACTISRWAMKVRVTVQDHKVRDITITAKMMSNLTGELMNTINGNIIDRQPPVFDAVSGASITGKAYLIAVTDALNRGME
ncbi:MAG: FMN-binding protein [Spirochaetia bacterium]